MLGLPCAEAAAFFLLLCGEDASAVVALYEYDAFDLMLTEWLDASHALPALVVVNRISRTMMA